MVPPTPVFHYQLADKVKCICSHSFSLKTSSKWFSQPWNLAANVWSILSPSWRKSCLKMWIGFIWLRTRSIQHNWKNLSSYNVDKCLNTWKTITFIPEIEKFNSSSRILCFSKCEQHLELGKKNSISESESIFVLRWNYVAAPTELILTASGYSDKSTMTVRQSVSVESQCLPEYPVPCHVPSDRHFYHTIRTSNP